MQRCVQDPLWRNSAQNTLLSPLLEYLRYVGRPSSEFRLGGDSGLQRYVRDTLQAPRSQIRLRQPLLDQQRYGGTAAPSCDPGPHELSPRRDEADEQACVNSCDLDALQHAWPYRGLQVRLPGREGCCLRGNTGRGLYALYCSFSRRWRRGRLCHLVLHKLRQRGPPGVQRPLPRRRGWRLPYRAVDRDVRGLVTGTITKVLSVSRN